MAHFKKPDEQPTTERWIETGTYLGDSVARALDLHYRDVQSIEIDEAVHRTALARFQAEPRVRLHRGSSPAVLATIIDPTKETTFWLDAHFSGPQLPSFDPALGQCPLLAELKVIAAAPWKRQPFLVIDDAFLFSPEVWSGRNPEVFLPDGYRHEEWPELQDIQGLLPNHRLDREGSYLFCTPWEVMSFRDVRVRTANRVES